VVADLVADIHDYLIQHPQGVFKTELVDAMVKHPYQHPRRKIKELLEKHTGQFWDEIQQQENNAKLFKPILDAVLPGTSDEA
jgi:hypothetical protein